MYAFAASPLEKRRYGGRCGMEEGMGRRKSVVFQCEFIYNIIELLYLRKVENGNR